MSTAPSSSAPGSEGEANKPHAFSSTQVLEVIRGLNDLTSTEKSLLEQLLNSQDYRMKLAMDSCSTLTQLQSELQRIARMPQPMSMSSSPAASPSASPVPESSHSGDAASIDLSRPTLVPFSSDFSIASASSAGLAGDKDVEMTPAPSSSSNTEDEKLSPLFAPIRTHLDSNPSAALKSSTHYLTTIVQNLRKAPHDLKNRRLLEKNPATKKNVTDVKGAKEFLSAIGFSLSTIQGKSYFDIPESSINQSLLAQAESFLDSIHSAAETKLNAPPAASGPSTPCPGGCGFYGNAATEGYCSKCHQAKIAGTLKKPTAAATTASPAKPAATVASPVAKPAPAPSGPSKLCVDNCGYFGSEKFRGQCSSCFAKNPRPPPHVKGSWKKKFRLAKLVLKGVRYFNMGKKPPQENRSLCWVCKRKLGILGIECKCGYVLCGDHRYPNTHDCAFDHQKAYRKKLAKENKIVASDKMDKFNGDTA